MAATIWKYELPEPSMDVFCIEMPETSDILDAQAQNGGAVLWVLVDPSSPKMERYFMLVGTGWRLDQPRIIGHIATIQSDGLVWHLFEMGVEECS